MTTDNEAAKIAGTLSAEEWAALEYFQTHDAYLISDEDEPLNDFDRLFIKGLLQKKYLDMGGMLSKSRYFPTDLGKQVLSAHVIAKPATGERVAVITAAESFVKGDTVYKVNANPQDLIPNGTKGVVQDVSLYNACVSVDFEGYGSKVIVARNLSHTEGVS